MITIKKGTMNIQLANNEFITVQDTSDGMYFRLKDGSEIRILCDVTAHVKAASKILSTSPAKNITIDFDAENIISIDG